MLRCFTSCSLQSSSLPPSENHRSTSQDNSAADTPRSNVVVSPTVNLSREFAKAVHSASYNEIRSKIYFVEQSENGEVNHQRQFLAQVLQPKHADIQEALQDARSNPFTQQISTYVDHTEQISQSLFILNQRISNARSLYLPIQELVDALPGDLDSPTEAHCNLAYDIFHQFDRMENPFSCPGSNNFNNMQSSFSDLKEHIDGCIGKSQSRVRMVRCATTGSAICFIGTVVGFAITAVSIVAHAAVALAAGSFFPTVLPNLTKKDLAHIALLDAAARSTYVLHNDLQTVDRLVRHLQTAVDGDKSLARLGISRGRERHPLSEVAKRFVRNHRSVQLQLTDLEEHICICFAAINRARSILLQEIRLHQNS